MKNILGQFLPIAVFHRWLLASCPLTLFLSPQGRGYFSFPCFRGSSNQQRVTNWGAHDRTRTGDLILTKDVLYLLSYMGNLSPVYRISYIVCRDPSPSILSPPRKKELLFKRYKSRTELSLITYPLSLRYTIYDILYTRLVGRDGFEPT